MRTYTVTAVCRNCDLISAKENTAVGVDLGCHEPNFSVQLSPDPNNRQVFQAACSVVNLHLRRHQKDINVAIAEQFRDLAEFSLSVQGAVARPSGSVSGGSQLQVELHITSRFSITAATSVSAGPHQENAPPDYGSRQIGSWRGLDWTWTPFSVGALVHFK